MTESGQKADRLEFANSLRGVAALSVVVQHMGAAFWLTPAVVTYFVGLAAVPVEPPGFARAIAAAGLNFGSFGVGLFFVISGFVIPYSLVKYDVRAFAIGRALRIYPTFWTGLALSVAAIGLCAAFFGGVVPFTAKELALHALAPLRPIFESRPVDGIVWTLEIELFFYMLCALLAGALAAGRRSVALAPFVLFAAWIAVFVFVARPPAEFAKLARRLEFVAVYIPFLILMFVGVAFNFRRRGLIGWPATIAWIAACLAMFSAAWATDFLDASWKKPLVGVIHLPSYMAAVAVFFISALLERRFRGNAISRFFANISYSLYVAHSILGYALLETLTRSGVAAAPALGISLVAVFAAAWAINVFVEMPTHRLGQRLAGELAARDRRADRAEVTS